MTDGLPAFRRLSALCLSGHAADERTAGEKPAAHWYTNLETALVRALGMSRLDLEPVYRAVSAALAGAGLLGFSPLQRKY